LSVKPIVLKVLLQHRHSQTHSAFCREYDRVAATVDQTLRGGWPSKAQFYRWLSGDLVGLPYADHCRILEAMLPGWRVDQLFQTHDGGAEPAPEPATPRAVTPTVRPTPPTGSSNQGFDQVVTFYPHRADTPKHLWMDLLLSAQENIDLFANASPWAQTVVATGLYSSRV